MHVDIYHKCMQCTAFVDLANSMQFAEFNDEREEVFKVRQDNRTLQATANYDI